MATKKGMTTTIFHLSLLLPFLDSGSGIRDPGWVKVRIRDPQHRRNVFINDEAFFLRTILQISCQVSASLYCHYNKLCTVCKIVVNLERESFRQIKLCRKLISGIWFGILGLGTNAASQITY